MHSNLYITAVILLGIGLGGFMDGILFHQIFQLHSMLSARLPQNDLVNVKTSMVWDGFFFTLTWIATFAGIICFWRAGKARDHAWSGRVLSGGLLLGWGLFNLVEGLIDHHLLNNHHIVERMGVSVYDGAYLLSGIVFGGIGIYLIRQGNKLSGNAPEVKWTA